jgi:hypothetical protein
VKLKAAVGGPSVPGETEKTDILLDAPQLKVKGLALEIENLELANLIRIGKVGLEVENLDAELFLQTQLGNLLHTVNLALGLLFAPAYNFNAAVAAWYNYLDLTRRWFEPPIKFSEDLKRPELPAVAKPLRLRKREYAVHAAIPAEEVTH